MRSRNGGAPSVALLGVRVRTDDTTMIGMAIMLASAS